MNPFGPLPDPQHLFGHDEAAQAFADILDARASEDEIQAFLVALTARGETMVEIAAAAQAMRERLIPIDAPEGAIDVCGTGGDGHHTLNVHRRVHRGRGVRGSCCEAWQPRCVIKGGCGRYA